MPLERRSIEGALTGKFRFELRNRRGDDHRIYVLRVGNRRVARTKVSTGTGSRTVGDNIVAEIAHQVGVPTPFFREMVGCTKSLEDLLGFLRLTGRL